jgi:hypothetical protein
MLLENPPHNILIHLNAEGMGDLLGDPRAAEARVTLLHLDDGTNQFW